MVPNSHTQREKQMDRLMTDKLTTRLITGEKQKERSKRDWHAYV